VVDCRILKKWILKKLEGVDWIDMAQDMGALNTVMDLNLPQKVVNFLNR
jgi:ABC-type cobalamin transport system permease subunit